MIASVTRLSRGPAKRQTTTESIRSFTLMAPLNGVGSCLMVGAMCSGDEDPVPVVSTGPYAYVRHPMYSGALLLLAAMPLGLGSWWSVLLVLPFFPVLVWRILDEEIFLRRNLPGYA